MPTPEQILAGHRPTRNTSIKTVIPSPQELAAREPDVEIHKTDGGIEFVRTPEERFRNLAGFPFEVSQVEIDGLRMAYLDEGPRDGEIVILAHGQPTYSYLYRKMIQPLVDAGHRVIAPDLIGLGQSDKPIDQRYHHYETHVANFNAFIDALGLEDITLLCQDWGSVIALRTVADRPEIFARVLLTNGSVGGWSIHPFYIPEPVELDEEAPEIMQALAPYMNEPFPVFFQAWINYTLTAAEFKPEQFIAAACAGGGRPLSPDEVAAYGAPFPSLIYRAGPRTLPSMVCGIGVKNLVAWGRLAQFDKPFLHVAASRDLHFGTQEIQDQFVELVPGAKGQQHTTLEAGHFIQDNAG
ncbi:MAG: alpha/beta fold hydrolase, partial [Deltaproteobacteria bacterium]|nr:alpha/beta fold hydrolase [Deltaproteobacteria bacterium]